MGSVDAVGLDGVGAAPHQAAETFGTPGLAEKSSISLFSRKPALHRSPISPRTR